MGRARNGSPTMRLSKVVLANGKEYGVAVFDHPQNPRHPTRWHVREYGLLAALIAVACVTILGNLGTHLNNTFNNVNNKIPGN